MQDVLNPDSLRYYRKKVGYHSQAKLAEKLGCRLDQVNRWETGRTKKPRPHLLAKLIDVLGVDWGKLTSPPPKEDGKSSPDLHTVQLNRRVQASTRTALEAVSKIYGVRWTDILELAPLLFMILAQQSLSAREKATKEADELLDKAAHLANKALPYLPGAYRGDHTEYELLMEEWASIKRRDVFQMYENEDGEETSPFVNHLQGLIDELFSIEIEISPRWYRAPDYEMPKEVIKELIGINGKDEDDASILELIQQGLLDLQEILTKKTELTVDCYEDWLKAKYHEVKNKVKAEQDKFLPSLFDALKSPDKQKPENTDAKENQ